jgi:hypothetical protein
MASVARTAGKELHQAALPELGPAVPEGNALCIELVLISGPERLTADRNEGR